MKNGQINFAAEINYCSFKTVLENYDLKIGGPIISSQNLLLIQSAEELDDFESKYGCYFIFSTIPKEHVPAIGGNTDENDEDSTDERENRFACFDIEINVGKDSFHCLYNGKGVLKSRLKRHLFSESTLTKALSSNTNEIPSLTTRAMPLEVVTSSDISALETKYKEKSALRAKLSKLKKVPEFLNGSKSKWNPGGDGLYFMNGINITEEKWSNYKWAICVIRADKDLGGPFIESAFASVNGRPPLCSRHG